MLGLLGLLGAVFAGFMVDAFTALDRSDPDGDQKDDAATGAQDHDAGGAGFGSLLDDPNAANGGTAGLAASQDGEVAPDQAVTLSGGAANDILTGDGGNDVISGNAGNDLLGGRAGDDVIHGGDGSDWMHGGGGADTLGGAACADDLQGADGQDRLDGGDGADRLSGGGGRDRLFAGAGNDALIGGAGGDVLRAGAGDDAVQGGLGHDLALGGAGSDTLDGNDGDDTIWGDRAAAGDDAATDFLNGGRGADALHIGAGDYANGGSGADSFVVHDIRIGDPVAQIVDFDPSEDRLVMLYDPDLHADPRVSIHNDQGTGNALVLLDGVPVAQVLGGAGLTAADVTLQAA